MTAASALAALAAASCTHYAPAPLRPDSFQPAFDGRRLPVAHHGPWTAVELLHVALDTNPALAEAEAKYRAAVRAIKVARNPPSSVLTLTAEYAEQSPHWGPAGSLDLPLDRGGRRSGRIAQAELQALQAFYDWQEAAWAVRTSLARARADLASADLQITQADAAVTLRRERVERMRRRVDAGEDDRLQQLTLATDLVAAQRRADDARSRRAQAWGAMSAALGLPVDAVRGLPLAPAAQPASLAGLPQWRSTAAAARRDVLHALVDYDLAENTLRVEVARQYPEVRVQPGVFWDHGVLKVPLTATLTLPPRDGNRAAIAQAEALRSASARSLEVVQAHVLATVDGAAGALQAAVLLRDRTRERDLSGAERLAVLAERKGRLGSGDRIELLGAQAALADAQAALSDAERARAAALVDLEDALRRPFDPEESALLAGRFTEGSIR